MMLTPQDVLEIMDELEMEIQPWNHHEKNYIIEDLDIMWSRLKKRIEQDISKPQSRSLVCDICKKDYEVTFAKRVGVLGKWCDECYKKVNIQEEMQYCKHFDCVFCYKEDSKYANVGCVGTKNCDYLK